MFGLSLQHALQFMSTPLGFGIALAVIFAEMLVVFVADFSNKLTYGCREVVLMLSLALFLTCGPICANGFSTETVIDLETRRRLFQLVSAVFVVLNCEMVVQLFRSRQRELCLLALYAIDTHARTELEIAEIVETEDRLADTQFGAVIRQTSLVWLPKTFWRMLCLSEACRQAAHTGLVRSLVDLHKVYRASEAQQHGSQHRF